MEIKHAIRGSKHAGLIYIPFYSAFHDGNLFLWSGDGDAEINCFYQCIRTTIERIDRFGG